MTLALPRDEMSVPVVRRLLKASMDVMGVESGVTSDIELALTEAVTNVLEHAQDADEYEVSVGVDGDDCVIEVVNRGRQQFDGAGEGHVQAPDGAEGGGIPLRGGVVHRGLFRDRSSGGTTVHLEKKLRWREGSLIQHMTEHAAETEHGPWSGSGDGPDGEPPR